MAGMKFTATIQQEGKTATGIPVPPEVVEALGAGKKPPVTVTLGDHTYRSTIAVRGDQFLIALSAENRTKVGVAGGDTVEVDIALDEAPREVVVPDDLAAALATDATATAAFAALSYSKQRALVLPIEQAKTPETRQRRVDKALETLRNG